MIDSAEHYHDEDFDPREACLVPAVFASWCANLQLLSEDFEAQWQQPLVRLRMRDARPSEFFTLTCAGALHAEQLSARGQEFAAQHYAGYRQLMLDWLGSPAQSRANEWSAYDFGAGYLTRNLMGSAAPHKPWWRRWF